MNVTDEMVEAGARVHCPFAFEDSDTMPIHRAQSRDEARRDVRTILEAALGEQVVVDEAFRKKIARIISPKASFHGLDGMRESQFQLDRRRVAYEKADAVIAAFSRQE
jgi:hypothetical protein